MVLIKCDNCEKKIKKTNKAYETYNTHFCNRNCYNEYKRSNKFKQPKRGKKDMRHQNMLKKWAKLCSQ